MAGQPSSSVASPLTRPAAHTRLAKATSAQAEELSFRAPRIVLERRYTYPSEIASAAVYLGSDAAAFITGQILAIDGARIA